MPKAANNVNDGNATETVISRRANGSNRCPPEVGFRLGADIGLFEMLAPYPTLTLTS